MKIRVRCFAALCRLVLLAGFALATSLAASADVLKITVDDTIHPITAEYIGRALEQAKASHADLVIIELKTPGGLLTSTRAIVEKIVASEVPVAVYVTPSGGYAASAGFFILQSADIAAMAPGTNTGAAHPVLSGGIPMDPVMKSKMENDAAAFIRSFVSKRGRNVAAAERAVIGSKSFTEQEALDQKIIDVIAKDQADLLRQLDGKTIKRFDGSETTLHVAGKPVNTLEMTLKQQVLAFLMNPNFTFLLFAIGMMAIYAEFNNPGAVIPGAVGLVAIFLALAAFNILPTRFSAVAMILGAFILFALEAKFASHGMLGTGGAVLMIVGGMLLVDGPIPEMRVKFLTALAVSIPMAAISVFLMTIALRARRNKVRTGSEGIVGELGRAHSALEPSGLTGKVFVHGELWNAVSATAIRQGEAVVVTRIRGLELEVAPAAEESRQ